MLTVGSLFSGIGGLDLGLSWAGFEHRWFVEQNPDRQTVLADHWPDATIYGDINALDLASIAPVDILVGGFPCQGFSLAGLRKGTADDRFLWPKMFEVVQAVRPRWVVAENVPGILSTQSGVAVGRVLSDLEGAGYDILRGPDGQAALLDIPACAVNAPHIRHRVFFVAHSTGEGFSERRGTQVGKHGPQPESERRRCACEKHSDGAEIGGEVGMADANRITPDRRGCCAGDVCGRRQEQADICGGNGGVGNPDCAREQQSRRMQREGRGRFIDTGANQLLGDSGRQGLQTPEQPGKPGAQEEGSGEERGATAEPGGACCVEHAQSDGRDEGRPEPDVRIWRPASPGAGGAGPLDHWNDAELLVCHDGKARRVPAAESGVRLVAHGVPKRVAQISGAGDAVVPQLGYMLGMAILAACEEVGA
ncbi:MAG: DNA cytosine methyltransferase [Desulfovibrionaceae bacterium]